MARVAVTGATGGLGRAVVPALVAGGHEVVALTRSPQQAGRRLPPDVPCHVVDLFDGETLTDCLRGCDAVVNLATARHAGCAPRWSAAWRTHDRLRTEGVQQVVAAAREAGVRRLVQESVSFLYADQGSEWVTEDSPVEITGATEPVCVGELFAQEFDDAVRTAVVLRFGTVVGDRAGTRRTLRAVAQRRVMRQGSPEGWKHVLHTDDVGGAVLAALSAPSGIYNVGAEPVRKADLVAGYAAAVGREPAAIVAPVMARMAGPRVEPLGRSLRVSSSAFTGCTGWSPHRASFDTSWLDAARPRTVATP